MCRMIAVANIKGGVGKTTTAVNLSASLAERGRKVLAIDLDPQSSLTVSLGFDPDQVKHTVLNLLDQDAEAVRASILSTPEGWDIIPSNSDLRGLERELESEPKRIYAVANVLLKIRKRYDYILLDCPANAGILTGAALAAADEVVIPMTADYLGFRVLGFLIRIIQEMQKEMNPKLRIAGIFLTMYDSRTRHSREILTALHNTYASEIPLFSAIIHQTVRLKEAPSAGKSIIKYAPNSQAAEGYRIIAGEIDQGIRGESKVYLEAMAVEPSPVVETEPPRSYAAFVRATELEPKSVQAWIGRAETAANDEEGVRCLIEALRLDPSGQQVRSQLEEKLRAYLQNATISQVPGLMLLAEDLSNVRFEREMGEVYRRVTELDPGREDAWIGRARTTDNAAERAAFVQRCLEINPDNPEAQKDEAPAKRGVKEEAFRLVERGFKLIHSGNMAEAHLLFKRAIQLDPVNDSAWLGCARTAESLPAKLSYVKQALEINPRNSDARALNQSIIRFMGTTEGERWTAAPSGAKGVSLGVAGLANLVSVYLLGALKVH